jgi:hypothetical protein
MKIGVRLLLSSMTFAIVIATVYGFTTHDVAGVVFLGMMALGLVIVAGFIVVAEREADLAGDRPDVLPADFVGEDLGTFTLESYWPILAAAGTACVIIGVVFLPGTSFGLMLTGVALVALSLRFLVREST